MTILVAYYCRSIPLLCIGVNAGEGERGRGRRNVSLAFSIPPERSLRLPNNRRFGEPEGESNLSGMVFQLGPCRDVGEVKPPR